MTRRSSPPAAVRFSPARWTQATTTVADEIRNLHMGYPDQADGRRGRSRAEKDSDSLKEPARKGPRLTLQFRELHNMTYELDCAGIPLVLRVFFAVGTGAEARFRAEARATHVHGFSEASATEPSRAQALEAIARDWLDTAAPAVSGIDWDGVKRAMTTVRAI